MKKRGELRWIFCRAVLLLAVAGIFLGAVNAGTSFAWFADTKTHKFEWKAGKVHYTAVAEWSEDPLVPGKNLLNSFQLTNESTIDTDLRLQISYTVWEKTASEAGIVSASAWYLKDASDGVGSPEDETQYLNLSLKRFDSTVPEAGGFLYRSGEGGAPGWWEYGRAVSKLGEDATTPAGVTVFEEPLVFCYDGQKTTNVFRNQPVTVTLHFQAKQHAYVTWEELGTVTVSGSL